MLSEAITTIPPAVEWISIDDAKQFLRIDGESLDLEVELMIGAARADLELATGQRLIEQEVRVLADNFGDLNHLQVGPVISIAEITYQEPAGATRTLDPAAYELFGAGLERGIRRSVDRTWPATRAASGVVAVTLKVGHGASSTAIPQQLRFALFSLLRSKFTGSPALIDRLIVNDRINP